jgi:hypothetical protein
MKLMRSEPALVAYGLLECAIHGVFVSAATAGNIGTQLDAATAGDDTALMNFQPLSNRARMILANVLHFFTQVKTKDSKELRSLLLDGCLQALAACCHALHYKHSPPYATAELDSLTAFVEDLTLQLLQFDPLLLLTVFSPSGNASIILFMCTLQQSFHS